MVQFEIEEDEKKTKYTSSSGSGNKKNAKSEKNIPPRARNSNSTKSGKTYVLPDYPYLCLSFLPIAICIVAVVVIVLAVQLANQHKGHLPKGMTYPPISLAMAKDPERTLGQFGFPIVSVLFIICYLPFKKTVIMTLEDRHKQNVSNACWAALFGFVCLGLVGAIPLQENAVNLSSKNTKVKLQLQSIIHQLAAAVFFVCSIWHSQTILGVMVDTKSPILNVNIKRNYASYLFKQGSMYMMFMPAVLSFVLHPTSSIAKMLNLNDLIKADDIGGIAQYIAVLAVMIFFTSYSIDFYHCHQINTKKLRLKKLD
jgi:hypothetical protein